MKTKTGVDAKRTVPQVLTAKEIDDILNAAYELLRDVGVRFDPDPRVMDLFSKAGCAVSRDGVVKIPRDVVESSLASVAKEVVLYDRNGEPMAIPGMSFGAGMGSINMIDVETGKRRPSTRKDLATVTRVVDALPHIDSICQPCKIVEQSDACGEIDEFNVIASHTTKPIVYLSEHVSSLKAAIEIAAAIRGGLDRLKQKPYFAYMVTQMPLFYTQSEIDQIFLAIENRVPLSCGSIVIGGATGPMTIAGCLVHGLATDFSLIALGQLIEKGCCCLSNTETSFMDPRTGNTGGIPESYLGELAKFQIYRGLGLPTGSKAGGGFSPVFNQDCATQIASSMMHAFYSGADATYYLGLVESGMTYCLQALLYCHEMAGMIRRMERGIAVNTDTLAMEVTRQVGLEGDYLAERHTVKHCRRELWQPGYFQSLDVETWKAQGQKDLLARIDDDLRHILATHRPEPLPEKTRCRVDEILERFGVKGP